MKKIFLSVVFFLSGIVLLFGAEFDKFLFENRENYWELTEAEIKKSFPNSFKFTSQKHDELRYNMRETKNKLTIKKFVVPEVVFSFAAGKVSEITVSIFNRGDYQFGIKKEAAILKMFESYVGELGGKVIESQKRRIEKTNVVYKRFGDEFNDYVYMVGNSDRGVEFINLKIVASGKAKSIKDMFKTRVAKLGNLTLNLQDDGSGGIYLDIPMVDQGQKGYCVCATVERILKYYQSDVDQHILAQIMKTEQQGTSLEVAMEALDGMRAKLRIKSKELIKNEAFNKVQDFEKVTKKYNRLAKRQKRNTIEFDEFIVRNGNKKSLEVDRLFSEYEYDLFRDIMCDDQMKQESFIRYVKKYVKKGYPLAWATWVFKNEKAGQKIGGIGSHMRIINGINEEKKLIIYTDSYGAGHEKKEMSYEDAFAKTRYLVLITPISMRVE